MRLSFEQPLPKGQPVTVTFYYDGHLTGQEDSPVYGIKFAAIHPDFAYLMYPGALVPGERLHHRPLRRRYQDHRAGGIRGGGQRHRFASGGRRQDHRTSSSFERPSFPGSIAVVKGDPVKVHGRGCHHVAVFPRRRGRAWRRPTGEEIGKQMSYFTGTFGLPPYANLTVVETEAGAPNGYAAPGPDLSGAAQHRAAGEQ